MLYQHQTQPSGQKTLHVWAVFPTCFQILICCIKTIIFILFLGPIIPCL